MKQLAMALLMMVLALPARAQLFPSSSVGGMMVGGLIGGIIGHNDGRHTAEGIAIGAGAGLLLGALANGSRREYVTRSYYEPAPRYVYARPSRAAAGAVLGGIAGGIIGHNDGRHTGEGIAIGAASGLLLGAIADAGARRAMEARSVETPQTTDASPAPVTAAPTVEPAVPAPSATANHRVTAPASRMAVANRLFGR